MKKINALWIFKVRSLLSKKPKNENLSLFGLIINMNRLSASTLKDGFEAY